MIENETKKPTLGCWVVPSYRGTSGSFLVLLNILPPPPSDAGKRPPVNLVISVDRSSSMVGTRIAAAVETVRQICLRLTEQDRLGVVAFDHHVKKVFGPRPLRSDEVEKPSLRLANLGLGIGTNIEAGWKAAAKLAILGSAPNEMKTVVLLTDGYPSVGMSRTAELSELVRKGRERGIITNTIGIGEGFREKLLTGMASSGEGVFRFVQHDQDITEIADEEVVGLTGLVAERAALQIEFAPSVHRKDILHRLRAETQDTKVVIHCGRLFAGSPRQVLFEIDSEPVGDNFGNVKLLLTASDGQEADVETIPIQVTGEDQRQEAFRQVGTAFVPLQVARALQEIWERGLDFEMTTVLEAIEDCNKRLDAIPEPLRQSTKAQDSLKHFHEICKRIESSGEIEPALKKSIAEESFVTSTGRIQPSSPKGWGKR